MSDYAPLPPKPALATPFPSKSHVPFRHILCATWASLTALFFGAGFVLAIAFTTNQKPTAGSLWVANAPVFVSLGGIIIKGSLGTLLGVALYQHLWSLLAVPSQDEKKGQSGLVLKQVESLHLASRLSVSMLFAPVAKVGWFLGIGGLLCTSVIVPVLQAGVDVISRTEIVPRSIQIPHAELDHRMASTGTALNSPEGARPNVKRSAMVAIFGEDIGFEYTKQNVTGKAVTDTISYTDVECNIVATPGTVPFASNVSRLRLRLPQFSFSREQLLILI